MTLNAIDPQAFSVKPHHLFDIRNLLLTAGSYTQGHYNTMTIGWGFLGTMWNKPVAVVAVRPTRHTYHFMEAFPDFTITAFPDTYAEDLVYLGTNSGRDGDKLAQTKLHAVAAARVGSPGFAEAELCIECKKIYWVDFDPSHFLDDTIQKNYPLKDYHRVYYGLIEAVFGTEVYKS